MRRIILENKIALLCKEKYGTGPCGLSVSFKYGHINEPKLGLAAVYETIVRKNAPDIASIYGGNITSFFATGKEENLQELVKKLHDQIITPPLTEETLQQAVNDIVRHTQDLSPLPMRQTKLAYKHTAFSRVQVNWDAEQYIQSVKSITLDDIRQYISMVYTGSNVVIGFTGLRHYFMDTEKIVAEQFGYLPKGKRMKLNNALYTGGFEKLTATAKSQIGIFGWDISNLSNAAELNVLISVLSGRLERQLAPIPAFSEVKIANYFGFKTLRILVMTENKKEFDKCLHIVCDNINRLCHSLISNRRMETSCQKAITMPSAKTPLPAAVEIAWHVLGRNTTYGIDDCLDAIYQVSPADVQNLANTIFTQNMTCVLYSNNTKETYSTLEKKILQS